MKQKRQPRHNNPKIRVDWKDLNILINEVYAFYQGKQKKAPCFTGIITGTVEEKKKCIIVSVKSCKKNKKLIGKTIALSYVPSKHMWHLLKEDRRTGLVYELKKAV